MTASLQIRKAQPSDLDTIRHILQTNSLTSDDITQHLENFLVAEINGVVVGTIGMEFYQNIGLLRSAAVLPSHQHQRIGDKLVASIHGYAQERGVNEIVLLTTTAEEYFKRKGFTTINRNEIDGQVLTSNQFNGACPSTAICMRMKL